MEDIYGVIGKLLAVLMAGLLAYLTPKVKAWLEAHTSRAAQERLAQAAEQLYHDTDPSGETRSRFVREQLSALGVEVTEAVCNMIEGAVWEINMETKKARAAGGGNG